MMNYSVYKHTAPNGKIYIGITSMKPENRWNNLNMSVKARRQSDG